MSNDNNFYIERTCTEIDYDAKGKIINIDRNKRLADFSTQEAYVLLGEPGAGKTKSFQHEAEIIGGKYIKAREFIAFDIQEEWKSKVLFIDGLDEVRSGVSNGLIPLDAIRNKLLNIGKPKFRISCREADWLGISDKHDIEAITSNNKITVLHLEELNEQKIREFSMQEDTSLDIKQFINWSHKHTLFPMLGNPQILKLIIKAISDNKWPESKREIYQIACEKMVLESNIAHQQSTISKKYSVKELMNAAGELFAYQIISGIEGYSLIQTAASEHNPYYGNIIENNIEVFELSLKTNFFKQGVNYELREPIHRSIAEYLAARYLSKLIENKGLPARRLLALITTVDGDVVSSLRGLFAWFLTLCPGERSNLLNHDPLGIVLYGDVASFSKEQKKELFSYLHKEAKDHAGFRSGNWLSSPFGALGTADMEDIIRRLLETSSRDDADQALVDCILDAVENGEKLTGLKYTLLNIIKDYTWWPGIRWTALRALLNMSLENDTDLILQILDDIKNEKIEDREDQLLGILLFNLYPKIIKTDTVFDYLHSQKYGNFYGKYIDFWSHELLNQTKDTDIPLLLEQIIQRSEIKESLHSNHTLFSFISKLLIDGITKFGDKITIERLYNWLGVGLDKHGVSILKGRDNEKNKITIQQWISDRPDKYKAILEEGISRCIKNKKNWKSIYLINARLFNAREPDSIGSWYLEQAEKIDSDSKEIAESYFSQAVNQLYNNYGNNFTLDTVISWVNKHTLFNSLLQKMLVVNGEDYDRILTIAQNKHNRKAGLSRKKTDYINVIIKHKEEIKNGTASPEIFHDIAFSFYGYFMEAEGDTPHERVSSFLNSSNELTECALIGLKKTLFRNDLPSVEEIIKTYTLGKTYHLSHAVLAGMEDRPLSDNSEWEKITDSAYKKAIAFCFVEYTGTTPDWLTQLLRSKPDLISKIFIQYVKASVRSGRDHITGLYQLAYDENWSGLAKISILVLLEKYPVRTKNTQIFNIKYMLMAALRYANKLTLIDLIDKKLNFSSMTNLQRGQWLATGLILASEKYEEDAVKFMKKGAVQVTAIANFLSMRDESWQPDFTLSASTLRILIEMLGKYIKPYKMSSGGYTVTSDMDIADMISNYIQELSRIDNTFATEGFEELIRLPELDEWRNKLKGALYENRKRVRDKYFIQPGIESVVKTLSNTKPSNAADLMALVLDHLEMLAINIRDKETNDYRQYWNTDQYNRPEKPKVEEACRDTLLSDLKIQLEKFNIHLEKEGYFVDDKRSDIKVSYIDGNKIVTPIEIKRDFHPDVWKSLWTQLIKQYTRDLDTQGYGIYVIFWFGTGATHPPPEGKKPSSADEMKQALLGMMTDEEKRLIGLCVIDCSFSNQDSNKP